MPQLGDDYHQTEYSDGRLLTYGSTKGLNQLIEKRPPKTTCRLFQRSRFSFLTLSRFSCSIV